MTLPGRTAHYFPPPEKLNLLIQLTGISQPRELPPQLLAEPGVNLSTHRAPITSTEKPPRPLQ